jgi:drug/metabolite transporter (DMT)-like permease
MSRRRQVLAGTGLITLSAFTYGTVPIAAKFAYRAGVNVPTLTTVRCTFGAITLIGLAAAMRGWTAPSRGQAAGLVALGALLYSSSSLLYFSAIHQMPASIAVPIVFTYPPLVAVLASVLGREGLRWERMAALFLGLIGISLIVGFTREGLTSFGLILAFGAALGYALYVLAVETAARGTHPLLSSGLILASATPALALFALATDGLRLGLGLAGWGWVILQGLMVSVAIASFVAAVTRIGPTRVALGDTLEPVVTVLVASAVLGEHLNARQALGAGIVVLAVAMLPFLGPRSRAAQTTRATGPGL